MLVTVVVVIVIVIVVVVYSLSIVGVKYLANTVVITLFGADVSWPKNDK